MNKHGFTLVEVLVVALILGLLAALVLPQLFRNVERARIAEGKALLQDVYSAETACLAETGTYSAATATLSTYVTLRTGPTFAAGSGETQFWSVPVIVPAGAGATATFTATITRKNIPAGNPFTGNTMSINQNGLVAGTHPLI